MQPESQNEPGALSFGLRFQKPQACRPEIQVASAQIFLVVVSLAQPHKSIREKARFDWNLYVFWQLQERLSGALLNIFFSPLERRLEPGFRIKIMSEDHHATEQKLRHSSIRKMQAAATWEEGGPQDAARNWANMSPLVESSRN
jgi:hypothetical protein